MKNFTLNLFIAIIHFFLFTASVSFSAVFTLAMYLSVPTLPTETSFDLVVCASEPNATLLLCSAFAPSPRTTADDFKAFPPLPIATV